MAVKRFFLPWVWMLTAILFSASPEAWAAERLHIAVAANFIQPFKELAALFEKKEGVKIEAAFASSGSLFNQIANGAPYDLFLSADEERPQLLEKNGLAEKPFVYARGQVVLWSARKDFCGSDSWKEALKKNLGRPMAMPNPKTAPYGLAAMTAMQRIGLWSSVEPNIVIAQTVAQGFHYASTEAVKAGFCALSSALSAEGRRGCFYAMEEAPPIIQAACLLKRTERRHKVEKFAAFLVSPEAIGIKKRHGYH